MNLKEICESRYSVRAYLPNNVEREKIEYILNCAQLAPSAANRQPWIFYVITSEEVKSKVQDAYSRDWYKDAPLYIVVCKDSSQSWKRSNSDNKDHGDIDAAIAAEHICLATHEQGLGTCWICNFTPEVLIEALDLQDSTIEPIAIFPIGYIDSAKSKVPNKVRKEKAEIVKWI